TKETPGWTAKPVPGLRHTVETTTTTGHTYHSMSPPLPGTAPTVTRSFASTSPLPGTAPAIGFDRVSTVRKGIRKRSRVQQPLLW
ncbi:HNH endonuclease, partial [Arthrobacter sp. C152]